MSQSELTPHELEKVETLAKTFNGGIGNAVFAAAELMAELRPTATESANTYGGLHKSLDRLVAAYVAETKKTLGETTLMEFIQWSGEKMKQEVKGAASADDRPHHA